MGTFSKSLIEGAVSLTSRKDLQDIIMRQNITYPLNSQPKFHNIQRDARFLDGSIITTNIDKFLSSVKKMSLPGKFQHYQFLGSTGQFFIAQ